MSRYMEDDEYAHMSRREWAEENGYVPDNDPPRRMSDRERAEFDASPMGQALARATAKVRNLSPRQFPDDGPPF